MEFLSRKEINKKSTEFYRKKKTKWRNNFHFEAPFGLINDPNGLCQYKGEYNLFFQWNPYVCEHKYKHWGIVKTKDFVNFTIPKIALVPEDKFDKDGCYSGGGIVYHDDFYVFYTGNVKNNGERNSYQCIGKVNGEEVEKLGSIIEELPKGYTSHFRDPYVWQKDDNFYMILGIQREELKGRAVLYKSQDLKKWNFLGELKSRYENFGYMWECPSLFELKDDLNEVNKEVLMFSPQGLEKEEYKYQNLYQSGYIVGDFNYSTLELENHNEFKELDMGFDFYAPQVFKDEKERTIMIGWMGMPEDEEFHKSKDDGWIHSLTMARELTLKNGVLYQNPLEEINSLRRNKICSINNKEINLLKIDEIKENSYELKLDLDKFMSNSFSLRFMEGEKEYVSLEYDFENQVCIIDRSNMNNGCNDKRKFILNNHNGNLKINMFVDKSSVEIYFQEGEKVASIRAYPEENSFNVRLLSKESVKINSLEVWEMDEVKYHE